MSGIIEYLEVLGRGDARASDVDGTELRLALGPDVRRLLVTSDVHGLASAAGVVSSLMSYVSAPENDPPAEDPAEVPDEPDQQDSEAA